MVYDVAIVGAGVSGLCLARVLLDAGDDRSILLVDGAADRHAFRALSFWSASPTPLDALVRHRWSRFVVADSKGARAVDLGVYRYQTFFLADLRRSVTEALRADPRHCVVEGRATEVRTEGDLTRVTVDGKPWEARWVFDSRLPREDPVANGDDDEPARQYFQGIVVRTEADAFDPSAAVFLDFRCGAGDGEAFAYLLPFSAREALVEMVSLRPMGSAAESALRRYLATVYGVAALEVTAREGGVSALVTKRLSPFVGPRTRRIGVAAGRLKPSTGYAVSRILEDSVAILRSLREPGAAMEAPKTRRLYGFLDEVFLLLWTRWPARMPRVFGAMFRGGPAEQVLRFLDERATARDLAALLWRLPLGPFLRPLLAWIGRRARLGVAAHGLLPHPLHGTDDHPLAARAMTTAQTAPANKDPWWSRTSEALLAELGSTPQGLTSAEAARRLRERGPNATEAPRRGPTAEAIVSQARNPLAWLLLFAAVVSAAVGEWRDAVVVVAILLLGSVLGVVQERRASRAVEALRARISARARVLRDGTEAQFAAAEVVPGDVVLLSAGSLVPADGVLLEARDLFASQAALTGETLPAEKRVGAVATDSGPAARTNVVFQGTSVRSGTARVLVLRTGRATEFGALAGRLVLRPPETDFDRGIRRFGFLLTRVMLVLVIVVFAGGMLRHKPVAASLLFAIALAVGLAPEMLPAILGVMLSHAARAMAARGVVVRRLSAIENLGSMDVLCTDKTGTLTEGAVHLEEAVDPDGAEAPRVLRLAWWNAALETGLSNPLDDALREQGSKAGLGPLPAKLDEVPYDFLRKRMSVVVRCDEATPLMVTKGAVDRVLDVCERVRDADGEVALDDAGRARLRARSDAWGADGIRVLGVSTRAVAEGKAIAAADERAMTFEGFLLFADPPKAGVGAVVRDLAGLGVALKVVTGDRRDVALHVASAIGLTVDGALDGRELAAMSDEALWHAAERTTIFAEVDPHQKERIILALRKTGHVVGYMGDGINDAPALHAADVGISVDTAVDVAREAADFVLLRQDLGTLRAGIEEGRATFANTMKYLLTTESANLGNMLSMAGASIVLPFLPLLASQVLLNNFLSDVPAMALARDNVDPELVARPQRWDLTFIRRFMVLFGLVSTAFDALIFALLLGVLHATPAAFRTGWFVASLATELLVALVVRTRRPFWRSLPGRFLLGSTVAVGVVGVALPYSPLGPTFSLVPLPLATMALLLGVAVAYALTVEGLKQRFFARLARR